MTRKEILKEFVEWYKKILEQDYDDKAKMMYRTEKLEIENSYYQGQCTAISRLINLLDRDLTKFLKKKNDLAKK